MLKSRIAVVVSGLIQQGSLRKNDRDQYQKGRAFT
jgi:hypothetical protein